MTFNEQKQYIKEDEYVKSGVGQFDKDKPFIAHPYHYPDKRFAYEVCRQGSGADRAIRHYHANPISYGNRGPDDPKEDMLPGRGDHEAMLYNRPALAAAPESATIWICEGEKDADTLTALGEVATTNSNGALFWRKSFSYELTGKVCVIVEDNDDAGRERTKKILSTVRKVAKSVSVVRFEDMPAKSDVTDFLDAGHTLEDLQARVEKLDELIFISTKTAEMVDQIETQLIRSGAEIYGRSDSLVRVVTGENGDIVLHAMTAHDLRDHISRHCSFAKLNKKGEQAPAAATLDMANTLLARVGRWSFKEVNGVNTAPLIRPNGEIVAKPGFDDETGLYLVLPDGAIQIGDTRQDAEAALEALKTDILGEFPNVDDVDLAVMMAGLLTPLVRAVITVAPMIAIRAHTPGTGKSYYVDCVSMLALGQKANGMTMTPGNEEENQKLLSAVAMEGRPLISIDNVNGAIRGDFIAQLIERPTVKPRILGKSEAPTIANIFSIFGNGNNLIIEGDLTRRVLLANLDAEMERPETRAFKGDPVRLLAANREKYLGYALTIIRSYLISGQRPEVRPFGSFDEWSRMVREPLVWLSMADPVDSVEAVRADDPELAAMTALFAAWPDRGQWTVGKLIEASGDRAGSIDDTPLRRALLEVAGDGREVINRKKLGNYLASIKRRPVSGRYIDARLDKKTKTNVYELVSVQPTLKIAA